MAPTGGIRDPLGTCSNIPDFVVYHIHVHFIFSIRWFLYLAAVLIALIYVIVEVAIESPRNLVSAAGMAFFILVFYITSHNPAKVSRLKRLLWYN